MKSIKVAIPSTNRTRDVMIERDTRAKDILEHLDLQSCVLTKPVDDFRLKKIDRKEEIYPLLNEGEKVYILEYARPERSQPRQNLSALNEPRQGTIYKIDIGRGVKFEDLVKELGLTQEGLVSTPDRKTPYTENSTRFKTVLKGKEIILFGSPVFIFNYPEL